MPDRCYLAVTVPLAHEADLREVLYDDRDGGDALDRDAATATYERDEVKGPLDVLEQLADAHIPCHGWHDHADEYPAYLFVVNADGALLMVPALGGMNPQAVVTVDAASAPHADSLATALAHADALAEFRATYAPTTEAPDAPTQ